MESILTVRLDASVKEEGSRVMKEHGYTPSSAVRALFDYAVKHEKLPFENKEKPSREEILRNIELFNQCRVKTPMNLTTKELKEMRLKEKYGVDA